MVDSAGNMTPDEVKRYFQVVQSENDMPLGFHGHNNLGLASANALMAFQCGAGVVDTSLQGMGRCTGNTVTEHFICLLDRLNVTHEYDLLELMDVSEEFVRPKLRQIGWDSVDIVCGLAGFHSSYMSVIKKYSVQYDIDPRKLIRAVCEENRLDAPDDLVEEKAIMLKAQARREGWKHKFPLDAYFGNEHVAMQ